MRKHVWVIMLLFLGGCGGPPADDRTAVSRSPEAADSPGAQADPSPSAAPGAARTALAAPPSEEERQRICEGIYNSYRCAQAIERRRLERAGDDVRRVDGALSLALDSGRRLVVADDSLAEWPTYYNYLGYLRGLDYYVLHAQHPEGRTVEVVHRASGWRSVLASVPQPAPGGRHVATASSGAYSSMTLSIYRAVEDTLAVAWELAPDDWAPERAIWTDSLSLRLIRGYAIYCEHVEEIPRSAEARDTARVWRGASGWQYEAPTVAPRIDSMEAEYPGSSCRQAPAV